MHLYSGLMHSLIFMHFYLSLKKLVLCFKMNIVKKWPNFSILWSLSALTVYCHNMIFSTNIWQFDLLYNIWCLLDFYKLMTVILWCFPRCYWFDTVYKHVILYFLLMNNSRIVTCFSYCTDDKILSEPYFKFFFKIHP